MHSISCAHEDGDDHVTETVETESQTAEIRGHLPFRVLSTGLEDGAIINDGSDTETVTISVVDGLEVAQGTNPANATMIAVDGDVTLSVDGQQTTKTLTGGSVSFDLTTDKPAGSVIAIVAESLADRPTEPDSATIEVVSQ